MGLTSDLSHKDKMYFVDGYIYNCPFCCRRNVRFSIINNFCFDVSNDKKSYVYIVECSELSCKKCSFHLSNFNLSRNHNDHRNFKAPPQEDIRNDDKKFISCPIKNNGKDIKEFDEAFYYHMPSSFFTIDKRIPSSIRIPLSESQSCLKNNFLIGSSAGLRKAIYKLLQEKQVPETDKEGNYLKHSERVSQLKEVCPELEDDYLEHLKDIHMLTSQELHENNWNDFDGKMINFLHTVLEEILRILYIYPDEKLKRRQVINKAKSDAKSK